jgi:hypothetical protein
MVAALLLTAGCDQLFGFDHVVVTHDGAATDALVMDVPSGSHPCLDGTFSTSFDMGQLDVGMAGSGTTQVVNGQVEITWPPGDAISNYGNVETQGRFDLTAGEVAVDLIAFEGDSADANLYIRSTVGDYTITVDLAMVLFYVNNGNGSGDHLVDSMSRGLLPLHLRISSDAENMVTFEASIDSATFSYSVPAAFPLTSVTPGFSAGSYKAAAVSGKATFDNFLVASPTCL